MKEVVSDGAITEPVELDLNITAELKEEGNVREFTRAVQELRKQEKLNPSDLVNLKIKTEEKGKILIQKFETEIKKTTLLKNISFEDIDGGIVVKVEDLNFELKINR